MMGTWGRAAFALATILSSTALCLAQAQNYADPNGDFALRPPEGWQVARNPLSDTGWITSFTKGTSALEIVVLRSAQELDRSALEATGGLLINTVLQDMQNNGAVLSQSIRQTSTAIPGASGAALRCDVEFTSREGDGVREKGYMLAVLGRRVAVLAAVSAPASDPASFQMIESAMKTLAIESRVPAGAEPAKSLAPVASAVSSGSSLLRLADKFKGNLQREPRNEVLCQGDPPLTYGSVAAFADLVGDCFSIQLTEAEFEATRQRFIEYYQKADPEGKAVIAQGWRKLLKDIRAADPASQAAMVAEVRNVMADRFRTGAQAGIGWAITMDEAIRKRSQSVGRTTAQKPAFANDQRFDSDFSQADLEASLEMLYFMWVASGRDPSLVTQDTVAQVQLQLVQGYPSFPPGLQYVLANAQQIYAGLRTQWENANAAQRLQMAQVFAQQLDALGFTVPSPQRSGGRSRSAWSDWEGKSHSDFAAEMVVGLAGSSYKSAW